MKYRFCTVAGAPFINGKPIPPALFRVEISDERGVISSGLSVYSRAHAIEQAKRWAQLPWDSEEIILTDLGCTAEPREARI